VCPPQLKCPYCGGVVVLLRDTQEYVCTKCGSVVQYYYCQIPEMPEKRNFDEAVEFIEKQGFRVSKRIYEIFAKLKGSSRVRAITAIYLCTKPRVTMPMLEKWFKVSRYSILRCLKRSNISWRQVRSNV